MTVTLSLVGANVVNEKFPDGVTFEEIATRAAMLFNEFNAKNILQDADFQEWKEKKKGEFFDLGLCYSLVYPGCLKIAEAFSNKDAEEIVKGQPLNPGMTLVAVIDWDVKTKLHPNYEGKKMNGSQKVEFAVENFQTTETGGQARIESVKRDHPMDSREIIDCAEVTFLNASKGLGSEDTEFGDKVELDYHPENPTQGRFIGVDIIATKIMDACMKLSPILKQEKHLAIAEENFNNQKSPNLAGLSWLVEKRAELEKEEKDARRKEEIKRQVEAKKQKARDRVAQYHQERVAQGKSSYGAGDAAGAGSAA